MEKDKESSHISAASASDKEWSYSRSPLASDTYRYSELSTATSIRVLKLHPAFSHTEALDCELLEIDDDLNVLSKEVTGYGGYEALSWCWGKQEKKEEILLREEEKIFSFHVSPTLNAALRAIRPTSHARFVWVDTICINQENGIEKSRQVARMDQIFARAKNVVIWLGEGDENSKLAMDFINGGLLSMWEFDKFYEDPKYTRHWSAMASFMQRPWFTRRWVLQEIALAKSGTLQCGSETVPWRDFADAVSLLLEKERVAEKLTGTILNYNTFGISG